TPPRERPKVSVGAAGSETRAERAATPEKAKSKAEKPQPEERTMAATTAKPRRFEFSEGKSNKFWEISRSGVGVTVRYGRIGADGQTKSKTFGDEATAQEHMDNLIEEKTEKGYEEVA